VLEAAPYFGVSFVSRGKRGDLIKLLQFDGDGCFYCRSGWSSAGHQYRTAYVPGCSSTESAAVSTSSLSGGTSRTCSRSVMN
jgi:hypothetical protein